MFIVTFEYHYATPLIVERDSLIEALDWAEAELKRGDSSVKRATIFERLTWGSYTERWTGEKVTA